MAQYSVDGYGAVHDVEGEMAVHTVTGSMARYGVLGVWTRYDVGLEFLEAEFLNFTLTGIGSLVESGFKAADISGSIEATGSLAGVGNIEAIIVGSIEGVGSLETNATGAHTGTGNVTDNGVLDGLGTSVRAGDGIILGYGRFDLAAFKAALDDGQIDSVADTTAIVFKTGVASVEITSEGGGVGGGFGARIGAGAAIGDGAPAASVTKNALVAGTIVGVGSAEADVNAVAGDATNVWPLTFTLGNKLLAPVAQTNTPRGNALAIGLLFRR